MSQDGYDVEVIGEVSSEFYCVICLKLMQNLSSFINYTHIVQTH